MKRILLLPVVLLTFMVSCKKEEEKPAEAATPDAPVKENLNVALDVRAEIDDNFALYYTEDNSINFTSEQAVWSGVKGGNQSNKVYLTLSEDILPTDIRLDFGINDKQGNVVLENFHMDYAGKSFEFKGSDFFKYFAPNNEVKAEIDAEKGTITFLKNPTKFQTPFFYPQPTILEELKKITN